jgi:membrane protein implicated in regulation of membrane protease activity
MPENSMAERNAHPRILLRIVAVSTALAGGAALVMSDDRVLKIVGAVILGIVLVLWFASDLIDAWSNERHVEKHPHLLKNEAIGQLVSVLGDFERHRGSASGHVLLHGEKWRATFIGSRLPKHGECLSVLRREGLSLIVQPRPGRDQ